MRDLPFPDWQEPYLEALMEPDPRKLVSRVKSAEKAILMRLGATAVGAEGQSEAQALEDALSGLGVLKREIAESNRSQQAPALELTRAAAS
ncbi:MAG: hypothetical protein WB987_18550 [Candidatus Acidiferrales bacterium]